MVSPQDIKGWIEENLPGATVEISGDGHHFEAVIVCNDFDGKTLIERHKMVYQALGDKMKAEIHALSMKTLTSQEKAI